MAESRRAAETQTLARSLRTLQFAGTAIDGLSIQEIAGELDVHRSIASRLLSPARKRT
ncbi:hypothetical protein ABT009_41340 [Streptomyces sp. NPDC002896]|uniref:hypothetical protein n=1 Tax=Streptomyces sp. NPDC002896 TaxID=3154438 RepID=UPI003319989B